MSCAYCSPTKLIPRCTGLLAIGSIGLINTDVFIYVEDLTMGQVYKQASTSSGTGIVTLDMDEPEKAFYSPDHAYKLWISLDPSEQFEEMLKITIEDLDYACLDLRFAKVIDDSGNPVTFPTQTVAIPNE